MREQFHQFSLVLSFSRMSFLFYFSLMFALLQVDATVKDICVDDASGLPGVCVHLLECHSMANVFRRDRSISMTVCNKDERKVCCPLSYLSTTAKPEDEPKKFFIKVLSKSDDISTRVDTPASSQITKKCSEYQKFQMKNETVNAFILGEPSTTRLTQFCYQNKRDIGTAIEKEFPHIAIIKLLSNSQTQDQLSRERKCVGSLVSDRHVLTSDHCVKSDLQQKVSVQLGAFRYDEDDAVQTYDVHEISTNYDLTILKLSKKVIFNQHVMPICLFPDEEITSEVLLVGWSGDWRECDTQLRKWQIESSLVKQKDWQLTIDSSVILNYRQTLLPGCPLQIYHPSNICQYSLIGVFEQSSDGQYFFNPLHKKLRWVQNIIWPKKLVQMTNKSYEIIKKGLKAIV